MSCILNIATAVPPHKVEGDGLVEFYAQAADTTDPDRFKQKLKFLNHKTKIASRYSCIPDYTRKSYELFENGDYKQPVEKRMQIYREKIVPLACDAIDGLFAESDVKPADVTHLITVTCTGLLAPGIEFLIAEKYGIEHVEKTSINFLGCYAGIKAIKLAHYISQADPSACILIVSAELCSLHFYPSDKDEELISNLLFADGAAAVLMCGDESSFARNKTVLRVDQVGSAYIPDTAEFMEWNLSASAFKMHLSPAVVVAIRENMKQVAKDFAGGGELKADHWAIHPGGVKIIEAVQQSLDLTDENAADSFAVLNQYGNMSSPTVLFILKRILDKIKDAAVTENKKIFSCAFGPGLNVELLMLSSVDRRMESAITNLFQNHDAASPVLR